MLHGRNNLDSFSRGNKNVLSNAKHFHCSCHATWLPCKNSTCKMFLIKSKKIHEGTSKCSICIPQMICHNYYYTFSVKIYCNADASRAWNSLLWACCKNHSKVSSDDSESHVTKQCHNTSTWLALNSVKQKHLNYILTAEGMLDLTNVLIEFFPCNGSKRKKTYTNCFSIFNQANDPILSIDNFP